MRALVVVTVLLAGMLLGSPAYAHAELVSSDPADGAKLAAPPPEVTLTFSAPVNPDLTRVAVTIDQKPAKTGDVQVDDNTVTVPMEGVPGRYRVVYRVVSTDGHRVDGELGFQVGGPTGEASAPDRIATGEAAAPVPTVTEATTGAADEPKARTVTRSWIWLVVGLGALVLIGWLTYVLTVGRNRDEDVSTSGDTTSQPDPDTGRDTGQGTG